MTTRLRDCAMAISLGPTARLIPAWGIAPGIKTHKLFPSANGAVHRCERVWVRWHGEVPGVMMGRAFSPDCVFSLFSGALPQAGMKTRLWRSALAPQRRQHF